MAPHRIALASDDPAGAVLLDAPAPGTLLAIDGEEAHHAVRVKRLEPGEPVELLTGAGLIAESSFDHAEKLGKKGGWRVIVRLDRLREEPKLTPRVEVRSAAPKGPRLEWMIDQLAQVGAASWGPLLTARSVTEPRDGKRQRLMRVAAEAAKQCGRAWTLEIGPERNLDAAIKRGSDQDAVLVVADASGEPYEPIGRESVRLLVGPEGGFDDGELDQLRSAGARVASFGPHTMRVETASVVAAASIIEHERRAILSAGSSRMETA